MNFNISLVIKTHHHFPDNKQFIKNSWRNLSVIRPHINNIHQLPL